jgi:hypothetical protein
MMHDLMWIAEEPIENKAHLWGSKTRNLDHGLRRDSRLSRQAEYRLADHELKEKTAVLQGHPHPTAFRRRSASGPKLGKRMARVRPAPKRNAGRAIR